MQLKDKRVLVFGAARSGISATGLLQKLGAFVILYDRDTSLTKDNYKDKFETDNSFLLVTGIMPEEMIDTIDIMVISPGVPTDLPEVLKIKEKNIPIWGEIELAYLCSKGKIIGITGTNGKTTTTTLVGNIMRTYFEEVYVVGNIGNSYTDVALDTTENAVIVIELSSFQLETIHEFKPDVSTILNITPDHLDRHHTMDNYIAMKERITLNQTEAEVCILNYEDEILRAIAESLHTKVIFFSSARKLENGLYLEGEDIFYSKNNEIQFVCNVNDLHVLGTHNYENVMVAAGIAVTLGIPMDFIRKAVTSFQGVEHRIEFVETINGVTYYNDSKGTNPDASIKAVKAMRNPTFLIAGGYDKKNSFEDFIRSFDGKVKYLVLLGKTKEIIADTARQQGFHNIIMVESLQDAVKWCAKNADPGDVVLLSPACASWDMFVDYEQRGRLFKEYVRELL